MKSFSVLVLVIVAVTETAPSDGIPWTKVTVVPPGSLWPLY
jgi:hypothetical protein